MSILHCVEASAGDGHVGGATIVVDGFAVAAAIAAEDPAAFELLRAVSVPFVHRRADSVEQGDAVHLLAEAPIIATDATGKVCGIRFHEPSMATLAIAPGSGRRHLRLCTVDRDQVHSRLRLLRRQLGFGDPDGWLPAGSLS